MDVQALHTDDGILIRVPESDEPPPSGIALIDPDEIGDLVTAEVGGSALFASRFRECAGRALLLPRRQPGRRTPLWQQRQRSAQLLEIASRYPAFPIVLETVREVLRDVFDVPALTGLLRDIAARRVRIVEVETATPSPFGKSLLFRYVGAFMYEGDAPLAERRAQALSLDTALLAELLGQDGLRELLDPAVVDQTERDLQHLSENRRCRDLEGVSDLLRTAGPLTALEVADRCVSDPAGWLAELAAARRVIEVRIAGQPMWAAIEDAGRLRDALGVPLPMGVPEAFTEPVADPLGDLVARYARTHGPFATAAVAGRYGLGPAVVTMTLRRLAADGRVVEGEFLPTGASAGVASAGGTEWCDAEVLRLLRRRCLARLRKEAEPVAPEVLARFLPAWHGIGSAAGTGSGGRRRADAGAVLEVVERLAGAPVPASALETLVLPGRIPGYSPALLDELTSAGEVVWSGAGALPGGDGWLVLAPADGAALMLPEPGEVSMTPLHEAVLEVLSGGGALFFRMLSDRAAALLSGSLPDDSEVAAAMWDLVWAGLLTNDTLAPLRVTLAGQQRRTPAPPRAAVPRAPAGRSWPAVRVRPAGDADPHRAAHGERPVVPAAGTAGAFRIVRAFRAFRAFWWRGCADRPRAHAGPDLAGAARRADQGRGRLGTDPRGVRRGVPGAAGHGGGGPVPARLLRGGTGRGPVRAARRGRPDARAGGGGPRGSGRPRGSGGPDRHPRSGGFRGSSPGRHRARGRRSGPAVRGGAALAGSPRRDAVVAPAGPQGGRAGRAGGRVARAVRRAGRADPAVLDR